MPANKISCSLVGMTSPEIVTLTTRTQWHTNYYQSKGWMELAGIYGLTDRMVVDHGFNLLAKLQYQDHHACRPVLAVYFVNPVIGHMNNLIVGTTQLDFFFERTIQLY